MYSNTVILGTHQKIDTIAYRQLRELIGEVPILATHSITHFEGRRGPDRTRLKKGKNESPRHFYDPINESRDFLEILEDHYAHLVKRLKAGDPVQAAFEAAWLAHALVDGLTPPHHFPYNEEIEDLRDSLPKTSKTIGGHFMIKGNTLKESLAKSLRVSGPKGLLTMHTLFELGAGTIIMPLRLTKARPSQNDLYELKRESFIDIFERYAREIDQFHMYRRFYKRGWTPKLTRDIRRELAPRMVRIVTLAWYGALSDAGLIEAQP